MDQQTKNELLEQFRQWLDTTGADAADGGVEAAADLPESADLYTLFVELAGLRTEVRTESRLVKDALDQFRAVFGQLEANQARLEREAGQARAELRDLSRTLLRPLLLDLLELRDRLEASVREPTPQPRRRRLFGFGRGPAPLPVPELAAWREGQVMTLRRLDRILLDRGVAPLDIMAQPFDPSRARAVAVVHESSRDRGVVVDVLRAGFAWNGEILRLADVVVNQIKPQEMGGQEGPLS